MAGAGQEGRRSPCHGVTTGSGSGVAGTGTAGTEAADTGTTGTGTAGTATTTGTPAGGGTAGTTATTDPNTPGERWNACTAGAKPLQDHQGPGFTSRRTGHGVQAHARRAGPLRAVDAPHCLALVRAGATFKDGRLVERPDDLTHVKKPPELTHPQVMTIARCDCGSRPLSNDLTGRAEVYRTAKVPDAGFPADPSAARILVAPGESGSTLVLEDR